MMMVLKTDNGDQPLLRISKKKERKVREGKVSKVERLQCQYVIPKKNRLCPLTRKKDELYCAQHMGKNENDVRIPCPVDSRHTIWSRDLKSHSTKCQTKLAALSDVSWYKENHNCDPANEEEHAGNFDVDYHKWIPLVENVYTQYQELPLIQKEHEGVQERMKELSNQKHAIQQSSLISHLESHGLFSHKYTYVEFGCGRAELSRYLLKSIILKDNRPANFLLIDRSPTRLKLDSKMVKDCADLNLQTKVHRVKIDIKDLYIDDILEKEFKENNDGYIAVSKHLCGAATDLTIECIMRNPVMKSKFKGMIVAMCCRHCCNYDMLSVQGKKYLASRGIDKPGFKHLMKFASWAVNGRRPNMTDDDGADHPSGLSIKQREQLGLKARRIIDEARRYTLQQHGYKAQLCQYVPRDVSLENTCLIVEAEEHGP